MHDMRIKKTTKLAYVQLKNGNFNSSSYVEVSGVRTHCTVLKSEN